MKEISPLRAEVHEFCNILNVISVMSFIYADRLKRLEPAGITSALEEEASNELIKINEYLDKGRKSVKSLSDIIEKAGFGRDYANEIRAVGEILHDLDAIAKNISTITDNIKKETMRNNIVKMIVELKKLPQACQSAADRINKFKDKIIADGRYYKV